MSFLLYLIIENDWSQRLEKRMNPWYERLEEDVQKLQTASIIIKK